MDTILDSILEALRETIRNLIIEIVDRNLGHTSTPEEFAKVEIRELDKISANLYYDGQLLGQFVFQKGSGEIEYNIRFNKHKS